MKKVIAFIFCVCAWTAVMSQAKKPIIMVVPSDLWCNQNGYMQTMEVNGDVVSYPDYKKALQENADLLLVISKINELMAERGFPLKNLESSLKSLEFTETEGALLTSRDGSSIAESPIDRLKRTAKADIWMQLTWTLNQTGPKRSLTFNLQGLDAYTDMQIAGASGTSAPTFSTELPVLLEEAVLLHLDNFNSQLQAHFDRLFESGREVTIMIRACMSENFMMFEQVMIPLFNEQDRALDARTWLRELQKYLRNQYAVEAKLMTRGLGFAQLVIGEK